MMLCDKRFEYPWRHFFRHPVLVLLIAINYWKRRAGQGPDEWYWADEELLRRAYGQQKIGFHMKHEDRK